MTMAPSASLNVRSLKSMSTSAGKTHFGSAECMPRSTAAQSEIGTNQPKPLAFSSLYLNCLIHSKIATDPTFTGIDFIPR
jgi:hypothetical protein